jgi:hypothetical protein
MYPVPCGFSFTTMAAVCDVTGSTTTVPARYTFPPGSVVTALGLNPDHRKVE